MASTFSFQQYPVRPTIEPQQVGQLLQLTNQNPQASMGAGPVPMGGASVPPVPQAPALTGGSMARLGQAANKMGVGDHRSEPSGDSQEMVKDAVRAYRARWPADLTDDPGAPMNAPLLMRYGFTPQQLHLMQQSGQVRL